MPTAFRIVKEKWTDDAFSGKGASASGGRWNSPGVQIAYASENVSLAVLEILVHLKATKTLPTFVLVGIEITESQILQVTADQLPADWSAVTPPEELKHMGDEWIVSSASVALRVPSAIIPFENNLLVNPSHPEFAKLPKHGPTPFAFDPRLIRW